MWLGPGDGDHIGMAVFCGDFWYVYTCIYIYMYVCMYDIQVYIYIYAYIYIYIHLLGRAGDFDDFHRQKLVVEDTP